MISISVLVSLYKCETYLEEFFSRVNCVDNLHEVEFIFIHNSPTKDEQAIIFYFLNSNKNIHYTYMQVPRESLYKSWNRGIATAKGDFITIWNVDDCRFPDSLRLQRDVLLNNIGVGMVYGNFEILGLTDTRYIEVKEFNSSVGLKKFQNGSFIMWRVVVHNIIGYFDEQLLIAGDQDFWYRLSSKFRIKKINLSLGQFRFYNTSALSSNSIKQSLERCFIAHRFGFWSPVNLLLYYDVKKHYDLANFYSFNEKCAYTNSSSRFNSENFVTFMKSIVLTTLYLIYPSCKRFRERNF